MDSYIIWFLLALGLLIAEMATGTFYMLALAIAMCVGGFAALLGLGEHWQLALSGIAGVVGILWLRRWRASRVVSPDQVNPDFGQPVEVLAWREDGRIRVRYRGADWDAELEAADLPHSNTLYITAMRGSTLIVSPHKQH